MSEREKQTAFLKQCLVYDDSSERRVLEESITQLQRNERSARRALWAVIQLAALGLAGLGCSAVLLADFPRNLPRFMTHYLPRMFCVLGLASVMCIPVFWWLWATYRKELDLLRNECLQLVAKLLESRMGTPDARRSPTILEGQQPVAGPRQIQEPSPETIALSGS